MKAGEEKEIRFSIAKDKLGYYDPEMRFLVEPGEYEFYVGADSQNCRMCRLTVHM